MTYVIFKRSFPTLSVDRVSGSNLGRCYNEHIYEVKSYIPITDERMTKLREAGFLGYGQEYGIRSRRVEVDMSQPVEVNEATGEPTGAPAYDYRGELVAPHPQNVYVVVFYDRIDSSD